MTRERDRYGRKSLAERAGDFVGWFRAHPIALLVVATFVGGIVVQIVAPQRSARPNDLIVGDCLFVPTSAANAVGPNTRPIGENADVSTVLMNGGAEQAGCAKSHGHEVSLVIDGPAASSTTYPGQGELAGYAGCAEAFESYVGRRLEGSTFTTFAVTPTREAWSSGLHRVICLVARLDGQWMTAPARASRQ